MGKTIQVIAPSTQGKTIQVVAPSTKGTTFQVIARLSFSPCHIIL
jgi:hypothetical protein